jgi:hypothetical protein
MIDAQTLFNISNVAFLTGTSLLIRAVIKNRSILKGYDWLGALLTFFAMLCVQGAYIVFIENGLSGYWISFVFSLPTVSYWFLVTVYTIRNKFAGRRLK